MASPYSRNHDNHEHHDPVHESTTLRPTISNTSTPSNNSFETTDSYGPSPIKIDHDYDLQHNLNTHRHAALAVPHTGTSSMLSPNTATLTIPESPGSQYGSWVPMTPQSADTDAGFLDIDGAAGSKNPFSFTPQQYVPGGRTLGRSSQENLPGKRKGHKYRHSSIHTAHQIFQAPAQRAPLAVPASLPVPTRGEAWLSLSRSQNIRLMWCFCHILMAGIIQFMASGSLALTALSRLLFFDAAGAVSCVAVDVMTNFEVWSRSTIRHPFGLGRVDVLAGFGMAVFIAFMGLDIISHGTQHALENLGSHEAHSSHSHERPSTIAVLLAASGAAAATLISAIGLGNHAHWSDYESAMAGSMEHCSWKPVPLPHSVLLPSTSSASSSKQSCIPHRRSILRIHRCWMHDCFWRALGYSTRKYLVDGIHSSFGQSCYKSARGRYRGGLLDQCRRRGQNLAGPLWSWAGGSQSSL